MPSQELLSGKSDKLTAREVLFIEREDPVGHIWTHLRLINGQWIKLAEKFAPMETTHEQAAKLFGAPIHLDT